MSNNGNSRLEDLYQYLDFTFQTQPTTHQNILTARRVVGIVKCENKSDDMNLKEVNRVVVN